jgi:hypothetical protein
MHHDHFLRASRPLRRESDAPDRRLRDKIRGDPRPLRREADALVRIGDPVRLGPSAERSMHKKGRSRTAFDPCAPRPLRRRADAQDLPRLPGRPLVRLGPSTERPMHLRSLRNLILLSVSGASQPFLGRADSLGLACRCASTRPQKGRYTWFMMPRLSDSLVRFDPSSEGPMHQAGYLAQLDRHGAPRSLLGGADAHASRGM